MPWSLSYDGVGKFVEVVYEGMISASDLFVIAGEKAALAQKHGTIRLLADCTTFTGGHTIADLYGFLEQILTQEFVTRVREAVILPVDASLHQQVTFWETLGQNRGLNVRVFADRASALAWLCL